MAEILQTGRKHCGKEGYKVLQTGRKYCGKRRNCSLRAIFPFSHSVFKKKTCTADM